MMRSPTGVASEVPKPNILLGAMGTPLYSQAWRGVRLETYPGWEGTVITAHRFHMISVQLSGTRHMTQRCHGRVYTNVHRVGDIIVTPAGREKEWINGRQSQAEVMLVSVLPQALASVVEDSQASSRSIELLDNFGTRDPQLEAIAARLFAESKDHDIANSMYVESLMTQLAIHLVRHYSTARVDRDSPASRLSPSKLQKALDYMNDHLQEDLSISDVARVVAMSGSHFSRSFKLTAGLSPHRYLLELRIARAKELFRHSTLTATEVAQCVGFSTLSHFSGTFKRLTRRTPRQFRKST